MKKAKKKTPCKKYKKRAARKRCLSAQAPRGRPQEVPDRQGPERARAGGGTTAPGTTAPAPTPAPTEDPGPRVPVLPPSNPRALQVISGEFFLTLSKAEVLSGNVRVEFNNAYAEDPHDLHLSARTATARATRSASCSPARSRRRRSTSKPAPGSSSAPCPSTQSKRHERQPHRQAEASSDRPGG